MTDEESERWKNFGEALRAWQTLKDYERSVGDSTGETFKRLLNEDPFFHMIVKVGMQLERARAAGIRDPFLPEYRVDQTLLDLLSRPIDTSQLELT